MQARAHPQSSALPYHLIRIASVIHSTTASLAQTPYEMLGIDESCPNNVWFLIKNLTNVGFQKNSQINVRLNLKIRNMLGYPKTTTANTPNSYDIHRIPSCPLMRVHCSAGRTKTTAYGDYIIRPTGADKGIYEMCPKSDAHP